MQQTRFALSVVALLLLRQAGAQAPVDLSGVWQMDASRSESAHQAVPIGPVTLTIKQTPAAIASKRGERRKISRRRPLRH